MNNTSVTLTERFDQALLYAAALHRAQVRKGRAVPYMAHLLGVTSIALEHGATEDEAIAALLHDAIEDQGGATTRDEIRRRFGERIVAIVDGCTDAETLPKPPWRQRKERFIAALAEMSPSVRLVVAADKLHNARSLIEDWRQEGDAVWRHFSGGKEGTLWYYRTIAASLEALGPTALTEELGRVVAEMERISDFGF